MADALDSKSSARKAVWVQVPPPVLLSRLSIYVRRRLPVDRRRPPIIGRRCLQSASSGDRVAPCGTRPGCSRPCCKDQLSSHTEKRNMANLARKNGVWLVRFRFLGKEFKRSLKTRLPADA